MEDDQDFTKFRYVLYARKSNTSEERQFRSIPDQISDCKKLATDLGLNIVKILRESKSAKMPAKRQIYTQMIEDIKRGKYNAILAWNPDRLARNMLEGGEIINLIDEEILLDLKFKTHFFTEDANGKMLLGMAFVLSKQYSDDLSQKVGRGIKARLKEGLTPTPKHGYINKDGIYEPDGENFKLPRKAWDQRLKGTSLEIITNDLNTSGYSKKVKSKNKLIRMDMRILSKIFHDPFYYGLLIQGGETVDLRMAYKFTPMITEDEFNQVQRLKYFKPMSKQHRLVFYPLRRLVACHLCNRPCVVAPSTSRSKIKYLYYRCDNFLCKRKKKSIRAKIVFDFISDFLADGLNFTEYEYSDYLKNMTVLTSKKKQSLVTELFSLRGALKKVKSEIDDISLKVVNYDNKSRIYQANYNKIVELTNEEQSLKERVEKLEEQLNKPQLYKLTVEQFLNLSKNASNIVKSADAIGKDQIVREIFLNLEVDEDKVAEYRLKEPFATLIKQRQLQLSRGAQN